MGERREQALTEAGLLRIWGGACSLSMCRAVGGAWDVANRMITVSGMGLLDSRAEICGAELGESWVWDDLAWLTVSMGVSGIKRPNS